MIYFYGGHKLNIMRKIVLISIISLGIMAFSSCAKDDIVRESKSEQQKSGTVLIKAGDNNKLSSTKENVKMRVLYCQWDWIWRDGGLVYEIIWCRCFGIITGNCLPTVTITASSSFVSNYENGTIPEYFSTDDYQDVFPGLDDLGIVEDLQNGDINLYKNHDEELELDLYIGLPDGVEYSETDTTWMSETQCVLVIGDE